MLINVLGLFTVVDAKGEHMDDSALVTTLAEFTIAPSYALQPYITWRSIDSMTAGATLEFNNRKVSGIFHFNEAGECTRFDTDSRWQFGEDASPIKWSAICGNYKEKNGIKFPTSFSAVWHEEKGDFEYFKGTISGLEFNVREYVGIRPSRF